MSDFLTLHLGFRILHQNQAPGNSGKENQDFSLELFSLFTLAISHVQLHFSVISISIWCQFRFASFSPLLFTILKSMNSNSNSS